MHSPSEIAERQREHTQLRAEAERLCCHFKALHDQSVELHRHDAETRFGSFQHEVQARLKAMGFTKT